MFKKLLIVLFGFFLYFYPFYFGVAVDKRFEGLSLAWGIIGGVIVFYLCEWIWEGK